MHLHASVDALPYIEYLVISWIYQEVRVVQSGFFHFLASVMIPVTTSSYPSSAFWRASQTSLSLAPAYTTSGAAMFRNVPTSFLRGSGATMRNELNFRPV